jgi:hypothetical protein
MLQRELEVSPAYVGETCDECARFAGLRGELRDMETSPLQVLDLQGTGFQDCVFEHLVARVLLNVRELEDSQARITGLFEGSQVEPLRAARAPQLAAYGKELIISHSFWKRADRR